ncbi:hypothetical protein M407DRAFT_22335 [Tulasnella calospora MUT 4182]|uniref:Uncharacterized protein n=1 Tax=Tulasnella calospora MUT 4182 TaxID=1051891 RepID=A0A0C3L3W8_9AGAM|nr:hypothetical protein M407DRAFT_22335 [Tulasnella calospora MUT 4182]
MTLLNEHEERPVGPESPTMELLRLAAPENPVCSYNNSPCRHGRSLHYATVVGETYGADQGIAAWCNQCETLCSFELFSGPNAVPKPQFPAMEDAGATGEKPAEPTLEILSIGKSRRAKGLQGPDDQL